ncbi:AAA family ATPase [Marinobacterium arenosum]|uniref:AAA family ATPase n=1 Tax=Marinobacterium arenosum TaxID=2862496 RepID=UPI001C94ACC9|nr:AAA family ATPase [Marinobacterium arenosum]MBY4676291.1 AAA family ATPase [Marinobacterium arenosum]
MHTEIARAIAAVDSVLYGKQLQVKLALTCLLSQGHLLIEDLPGMGKTTLAHALARVLGLEYQRVQFTSDMLPGDILGVSVFSAANGEFRFHPGPVFSQLLLADEINRTTPKTQSALLEAMEEQQVTLEGVTRPLPSPFFVIATQNPISQYGTFPLPESQLDRFLMRISLGYPAPEAERLLLKGGDVRGRIEQLPVCLASEQLLEVRARAADVKTSDSLLDYLQRLVGYSRESGQFAYGISPRGALALLSCAKTWALLNGRQYVVPEDLQQLLGPVFGHRLRAAEDYGEHGGEALIRLLLREVDVVG